VSLSEYTVRIWLSKQLYNSPLKWLSM